MIIDYLRPKTYVIFADGMPPPKAGKVFMVIEYNRKIDSYLVQALDGTIRKYKANRNEVRPFWLQRGDKFMKTSGDKKQIIELVYSSHYDLEVNYKMLVGKQESKVTVKWLETKFEKFL